MKHGSADVGCTFEVHLQRPLDLAASLERFRQWGDDLLERWDGRVWLRTHRDRLGAFPYSCLVEGNLDSPRLVVTVERPERRQLLERELAATFPSASLDELAKRDPVIARLRGLHPGVRPVVTSDPMTALVRSISAQQITLRFAATIRRRLALAFGTPHSVGGTEIYSLDAARLTQAPVEDLRALQLSRTKAGSIRAVAAASGDGELELENLRRLDDEALIEHLVRLPGIGRWTAEWFLARSLGRPRVVAGDLGVRKAVGRAYLEGRLPTETEVRELTSDWGAAAGLAQQLLLHGLTEGSL